MAKRRHVLAGVAALATFGAVLASAATIGGVSADSLGADTSVVASCDTDGVNLSYGSFTLSGGAYKVGSVTVSGIAATCNGKAIRVTLSDAGGSLGEATGTVSGTSQVLNFTAPGPDAKSVTNAAVVISG
jgi:hypothetical protein